jgi:hypothetical protein
MMLMHDSEQQKSNDRNVTSSHTPYYSSTILLLPRVLTPIENSFWCYYCIQFPLINSATFDPTVLG